MTENVINAPANQYVAPFKPSMPFDAYMIEAHILSIIMMVGSIFTAGIDNKKFMGLCPRPFNIYITEPD